MGTGKSGRAVVRVDGLISQVLADRAPFSGEPTRPGAAVATLAFAEYARSLSQTTPFGDVGPFGS